MENICSIHSITFTETGVCPECLSPVGDPVNVADPIKIGDSVAIDNSVSPLESELIEDEKLPDGAGEEPSHNGNNPDTSREGKYEPPVADGNSEEKEPEEDDDDDDDESVSGDSHSKEERFERVVKKAFKDSSKDHVGIKDSFLSGVNIIQDCILTREIQESNASKLSLYEMSSPTRVEGYEELEKDHLELVSSLQKERVLLLGNCGDGQAQRVSRQIAKCLKIKKEENVRFISLNYRTPDDNKDLNIHSFTFERALKKGKSDKEAVIIIDATLHGDHFADSLLNDDSAPLVHPTILQQNALFLICLLEAKKIEEWKGAAWEKIFPYRVIRKKETQEPKSENKVDIKTAEALLENDDEIDAPIIRTVLFVASFFPNLTTGDFNELVGKFLESEPDVTKSETAGEGAEATVKVISLKKVWELKSHIFTERCFLIQTKDDQGQRTVDFQDQSYSRLFKDRLDSRFFVFLDKKLSEILNFGLIFYSSDAISGHTINILSEFIPQIKERYADWLLEIFAFLETRENIDELRASLGLEVIRNKHFYYRRLADLFRAMSGELLEKIGWDVMDKLVRNKYFKSVLILIKQLQFSPNLDTAYWLKQLLERGDSDTKKQAFGYLFSSLVNTNIRKITDRLKAWLPEDTRPIEKYSDSNKAALTLIIEYYAYQTQVFDEELYGLEPCQFPLFRFDSESSAESQIDLIIKYLMHRIFLSSDKFPYTFDVALILAEWTEILCSSPPGSRGPNLDPPTAVKPVIAAENTFLSNVKILDRLLEQTCLNSDKTQQGEILFVWEKYLEELTLLLDDLSVEWKLRESASKKRRMIRNLKEKFKKCQRSLNNIR